MEDSARVREVGQLSATIDVYELGSALKKGNQYCFLGYMIRFLTTWEKQRILR